MKLSAAIELALTSGEYNQVNEFMCIVLPKIGQKRHVAAVQEMVNSIHPNTGDIPLACALHSRGIINLNDGSWGNARQFAFTQQFYVWWVFDLKRKGL